MKSAVLASLLFGSLAMAAPVDKRDVATKTEIVTETVVVYTTVYDDAAPTSLEGLFYEKPTAQPGAPGAPGAPGQPGQPGQPGAPGSAATSTAQAPAQPEVTKAPEPAPAPEPTKPTTTEQPQQQAPQQQQAAPTTQAAPAQSTPQTESKPASGGMTYNDVDMTIYDNNGGFGACGTELHDSDMIVALAKDAWGQSTYDVMTGAATNPWCGQKINIEYNGNSIQATIMDLCPGCSGHDIDLSLSAWKALTGMDEKTRLKASWSKAS